jgi:hypothetical protein
MTAYHIEKIHIKYGSLHALVQPAGFCLAASQTGGVSAMRADIGIHAHFRHLAMGLPKDHRSPSATLAPTGGLV